MKVAILEEIKVLQEKFDNCNIFEVKVSLIGEIIIEIKISSIQGSSQ